MTERELIQQQQELGDSRFLVTRSGKFFSAYGCGAFALARATGYRVMHRQRKGGNFVLTTGFPESHVGKVMEQIIAAGGKIDRQDDGSFVFSGIDDAKQAVKGLESATGLIRHEVGKRLRLRKAPELKFAADDSVEHGMEIFRKIEALKKDDEEDK
jgi:hypothetical protein